MATQSRRNKLKSFPAVRQFVFGMVVVSAVTPALYGQGPDTQTHLLQFEYAEWL